MTATLAAPSPDHIELLVLGFVLFVAFYVCVFEIGLPTFRRMVRERRNPRPGYLYERDDDRVGL